VSSRKAFIQSTEQHIGKDLEGYMKRGKWIVAMAVLTLGLSAGAFAQEQRWDNGRNRDGYVYNQRDTRDRAQVWNDGYRDNDDRDRVWNNSYRDRDDHYRERDDQHRDRDHHDRDRDRRDRDDRGRDRN
jgi:hypothetical protein